MDEQMTDGERSCRLLSIIFAWRGFSNAPLRCTDAADSLTDEDIVNVEQVLRKLVTHYRSEDAAKWPELRELADRIEKHLPKPA